MTDETRYRAAPATPLLRPLHGRVREQMIDCGSVVQVVRSTDSPGLHRRNSALPLRAKTGPGALR